MKRRMGEYFDHYIDRAIREAMDEGKFDNLPGAGQPIRLEDAPFVDAGTQMAHHLLKTNNFAPAWIEERRELEEEIRAAHGDLQRARQWIARVGLAPTRSSEWERACRAFRERVATLNRRIRDFNLKAPDVTVHLRLIEAERVIDRIATG